MLSCIGLFDQPPTIRELAEFIGCSHLKEYRTDDSVTVRDSSPVEKQYWIENG